MTTLICSGTLFSNWHRTFKRAVPSSIVERSTYAEISALSEDILRQQFPDTDELAWTPFTPNSDFLNKAVQLFDRANSESVVIWGDNNTCLQLDFWKTAAGNGKFLLFYSSPEFELSQFINSNEYDVSRVSKVIDAWFIRTRAMMTFFMNNRECCFLLDTQCASRNNKSFTNLLKSQFDLTLIATPDTSEKNSVLLEFLATTQLLKNQQVAELYDEVRSAASLIKEQDKSIPKIESRNNHLIDAYLNEYQRYVNIEKELKHVKSELNLDQLQISQMQSELEDYFTKSISQEKTARTMTDYLSSDPLLRIARQVRPPQ